MACNATSEILNSITFRARSTAMPLQGLYESGEVVRGHKKPQYVNGTRIWQADHNKDLDGIAFIRRVRIALNP